MMDDKKKMPDAKKKDQGAKKQSPDGKQKVEAAKKHTDHKVKK